MINRCEFDKLSFEQKIAELLSFRSNGFSNNDIATIIEINPKETSQYLSLSNHLKLHCPDWQSAIIIKGIDREFLSWRKALVKFSEGLSTGNLAEEIDLLVDEIKERYETGEKICQGSRPRFLPDRRRRGRSAR